MGCSLPAASYLAERKDAIQTNETMACDFKAILCARIVSWMFWLIATGLFFGGCSAQPSLFPSYGSPMECKCDIKIYSGAPLACLLWLPEERLTADLATYLYSWDFKGHVRELGWIISFPTENLFHDNIKCMTALVVTTKTNKRNNNYHNR